MSKGFRTAATAAGIEGARLRDLRHYFATTLLSAGVNVKVVSEALGHASTAFTMGVYQHTCCQRWGGRRRRRSKRH